MKYLTGVLYFIKSVNPPVFRTPLAIKYLVAPKKGQAFLFASLGHPYCNLSTVQKVRKLDAFTWIKTRNSYYVLETEGGQDNG